MLPSQASSPASRLPQVSHWPCNLCRNRSSTGIETCTGPVGAGLPAMRPAQPPQHFLPKQAPLALKLGQKQILHRNRNLHMTCRSGLARDEAGTAPTTFSAQTESTKATPRSPLLFITIEIVTFSCAHRGPDCGPPARSHARPRFPFGAVRFRSP